MFLQTQRGQILPLGLALLALSMMGIFVLYNTGQVASDKMRLANSADAAAYSGALLQARALNFQAYSNRAMVANQVSMAQAVTLNSWVKYGAVSSENISTVLKPIPVINVLAQGIQTGFKEVEKVITPISESLLSAVNTVNRGLSLSQEAMFMSTFAAIPDVVQSVVAKTDDRFSVDTAYSTIGLSENLKNWGDFTQSIDTDDSTAMKQRVDMINQSRDAFTAERNWKFFKNFWFYSTPLLRHRLYREGRTELMQVVKNDELHWEWKAKDTLSLHNRLWRWRGTKKIEAPIGWSRSFANSLQEEATIDPNACSSALSFRNSSHCSRLLGMNRSAEMFADTGVRSPVSGIQTDSALDGYSGLNSHRSLSSQSLEAEFPILQLKIEVSMPIVNARLSDQTSVGEMFKAPGVGLGGVMSSISNAEVFYQRPDENLDGELEYANGYNPYWAVKLSPVTQQDRLEAISFRSIDSVAPPVSSPIGASTVLSSENLENTLQLPTYQDGQIEQLSNNSILSGYNSAAQNYTGSLIDDELTQELSESSQRYPQSITTASIQGLSSAGAEQPYDEVIQEAERLAEEFSSEFIRIQTEVSDNFEAVYRESASILDQELADIDSEIADLRNEIQNGSHNEDVLRELQQRIDANQERAQRRSTEFRESLARQLMDIVSDATDLYVMRYAEATYTVDEWLRSDLDQIRLPWTELPDDE